MELAWLEDFLALFETGNFNRAAEMRNLTQPAFSRRIKALEDWAGAGLFDRSTHRVEPTAAGHAFHRSAEDILRRVLSARGEIRRIADGEAAALRFAATHALSLTFFPGWLRSVERRVATAGIHLMSDTMQSCEQAMRKGQAQFLLCHARPGAPGRLDAACFTWVKVGGDVLAPLSAPGPDGKPLYALPGAPDAPLPLLSYSAQSALGRAIQDTPVGRGAPCWLENVVTAHQATVLRAMARDGRGIALLPLGLAQADLDDGVLVRAGGPQWDAEMDIHLFRPRARQSPAAEEFWRAAACGV